jgi:hypothetical protein
MRHLKELENKQEQSKPQSSRNEKNKTIIEGNINEMET